MRKECLPKSIKGRLYWLGALSNRYVTVIVLLTVIVTVIVTVSKNYGALRVRGGLILPSFFNPFDHFF